MTRWYALTHLGAEPALQKELESRGIRSETKVGGCSFEADENTVAKLLYHVQCATRLLLAVDEGDFDSLDASKAEQHIGEDQTFRISAETLPAGPDLTSPEIGHHLGGQISREVDLEKPDVTVFCQAGSQSLLGIDIAGDLSKRYYRVFTTRQSVKGTLAAAIHWRFKTGGGMLDPFGGSGEIVIEEAMRRTNTSPLRYKKHERIAILDEKRKEAFVDDEHEPENGLWCFDAQLGNLRNCKKNAKLAGVEKRIEFSKLDPEWIDIKFGEDDIKEIVTIPPPITNRNPDDTHIKELVYQAEFIIHSGKGRMIVACLTEDTVAALAKHAKAYKFSLTDEAVVYSGKLPIHVMCYEL